MRLKYLMLSVAGLALLAAWMVMLADPTPPALAQDQPTPTSPPAAFPTPNPSPTCTLAVFLPEDPNIPPVGSDDWIKGPAEAPITLIEYGDFQCPYCARMPPLLESLLDSHKDQLRVVYRHFPLTMIHDKAMITAEAAEAAGAQGAFWEMTHLIYEQEWAGKSPAEMPQLLSGYAKELNLDVTAFEQALANHTYQTKVQAAYDSAMKIGLPGTPSFVVNGMHYPAQQIGFSPEAFDLFFKFVELQRYQFKEVPPQVIEKGKQYQATIQTEKGEIVVELYPEQAPLTVNSFVFLAQQGWYSNTTFHRVVPGFVAQAGDPTGTGMAWPGYYCSDELTPELTFDAPGMLGMANHGADTNGSQFFITLAPAPTLNGKYTVFGKVIKGLEVAQALSERDPQSAPPEQKGDRLINITITSSSKP